MSDTTKRSVAMIGSYVPRRCGIATFTHDLSTGIAESVFGEPLSKSPHVGIIALNDHDETYAYDAQVAHELRDHVKEDYRNAADFLNHSKYEAVCIQHEYGIYGGRDGDYLLAMLDRLTKPVICTLHTVLAEPSPGQYRVLRELVDRSATVVVMAQRAVQMLVEVFNISPAKISLIHHGVPDAPFGDTEPFKRRFEVAGRPTILTFGLLGPNKGIENMIEAVARVVPEHPDLAYIVLGATHPGVRRESGESYRLGLEKLADQLRVTDNVAFHNRYVSLDDLCEYLCASDIYVTPYRSEQQIVSGTLAYAVACGCAVVSTPYWYAQEILADDRGMLVPFDDVDALVDALHTLLGDDGRRTKLRKSAYDFGRSMVWSNVAWEYAKVLDAAVKEHVSESPPPTEAKRPAMRLTLPEVRLDHLHRMSDDTGLLQHAVHATPDRRHGYSVDDVARGMVVTATRYRLFKDEKVLRLFDTYLSCIHHACNDTGRFRNFMSYERRWLEQDGSDDCQGRVLWALGCGVAHAPHSLSRELCETLFQGLAPHFDKIQPMRSLAFAILGCEYFLRRNPNDTRIADMMGRLASRIAERFDRNESADWRWFEDVVTYDNGRLSQAMIVAGMHFNDETMVARGCRVLDWLLEVQTGDGGQLSLIGNEGWLRRGQTKAEFDQQPVEVSALVSACQAAFRAGGQQRYLREMRRCFDWFLGSNDQKKPLIDFKTRGCFDGLTRDGVNANQGAESLLSWLMSLLIMHEMQTGDPTQRLG